VKRVSFFALGLALLATTAPVRGQAAAAPAAAAPAGAAVDPISTYLRQETQLALVVDLNQIDLDQLIQYATAKAKEQKVPQAEIDKGMAEAKPQIDQAKAVIGQFRRPARARCTR
jgi:hypothetical protein